MMMRSLLIVKTGSTLDSIARRRGDFERWFSEGVGSGPWREEVVDVQQGEALPDPHGLAGVIVTGSPAMVSHREPWSEATAAWLPAVVEAGIPLLGVCYGHQLLAHALGGVVGINPLGLEMNTVDFTLTPTGREDPLLGSMPGVLQVQATHTESVLELPTGARLLGHTPGDPHHAFVVGDCAWGIQFHPECDADILRCYIRERWQSIVENGQDPARLLESAADSPHGRMMLRRFGELVAAHQQQDP